MRNRFRRRLRELYRLARPSISLEYDIVLMAKTFLQNQAFQDSRKDFVTGLVKGGLWHA